MAVAVHPEEISEFLSEQRANAPEELQQTFLDIEDYWERKLWHQLTDVLEAYFSNPASASQRLALFSKFILPFAPKINQLKFVSLGLLTATQSPGTAHAFDLVLPMLTELYQMISHAYNSFKS